MRRRGWGHVALALVMAAGVVALSGSPAQAGPDGQSCIRSRLTTTTDGVVKPVALWNASVWGVPPGGGTQVLLTGAYTDFDGWFQACFPDAAAPDNPTGGQDIRVIYWSQNPWWQIRTNDTTAAVAPSSLNGVDAGVRSVPITASRSTPFELSASGVTPSHGAWKATQTSASILKTWQWVTAYNMEHGASISCWDLWEPTGSPCPQYTVNIVKPGTNLAPFTASFYAYPANQVVLWPGDELNEDVVIHEVAHNYMHDLYGYTPTDFPMYPLCYTHYVDRVVQRSDGLPLTDADKEQAKVCAYTEGFADWMSSMVRKSPTFLGYNLESASPGTWETGEMVEGRFAGLLLDLADTATEAGDTFSDQAASPWKAGDTITTVALSKPRTFKEYWCKRRYLGLPSPDALVTLNTLAVPNCAVP